MEKTYAFIKDNVVENIFVFSEENQQLAESIMVEQGYDSFVYIGENPDPARWSFYDGKTFTDPTDEYLISIGVKNPEVVDETAPE